MKYVVLRDDDANATTPVSLLEPLYRPFLDRGFPVHLAMIPAVRTDIRRPDGGLEAFIRGQSAGTGETKPLAENVALIDYVRHERGYVPVMHGFTHEYVELQRDDPAGIAMRLDRGLAIMQAAGLGRPRTFVAPQDQLSRSSMREVLERFDILSTQFLSLKKLPRRYWPAYLRAMKWRNRSHLCIGRTTLLTHPGCILSYMKPARGMLERVVDAIRPDDVTVIVTHHWEYFHSDGSMNEPLVAVLHSLAEYLTRARDVRVIRFDEARDHIQ